MKKENNLRAWVVGFAVIIVAMLATLPLSVASLFIPSMIAAMGASASAVSLYVSISSIGGLVASLLLGTLLKKFSIKTLIIVGGLFSGSLMIAIGLTESLPIIYFTAFLQGVSLIISGAAIAQIVITNWFVEKRGLMMSFILVILMLSAAILNMVLARLIVAVGYQPVALWLGIIAAAGIVLLGAFVIVDSPVRLGLHPYGASEAPASETAAAAVEASGSIVNFSTKQALKTLPLWCVILFMTLTNIASQGIGSQGLTFYQSLGLDAITASNMIAVNALAAIVFSLVAGIVADKKGPTASAIITAGAGMLAFLLTFLWSGSTGALIAAILFAGVSSTSVYAPLIIAKLYGSRDMGGMLGLANAAGNIGTFIGPVFAAAMYDANGNYVLAYEIIGVLLLIAIILTLVADSKKQAEKLKSIEAVSA